MVNIWEAGYVVGLDSAGMLLTTEEFDAIDEYDETYRYELINGVLVVTEFAQPDIASANDLLSYFIRTYFDQLGEPDLFDRTLPTQYLYTRQSRRIMDRLIWVGLGRMPKLRRDPPSIVIEFQSPSRRSSPRDIIEKRQECREAGVEEFWSIDFCTRAMTAVRFLPGRVEEQIVRDSDEYTTRLLPGFKVPLARLIKSAIDHQHANDSESRFA